MQRVSVQFTMRQLLLLVAVTAAGLALAPAGAEYFAAFLPAAVVLRRFVPELANVLGGFGLAFFAFGELLLAIPISGCLYLAVTLALAPPWRLFESQRPAESRELEGPPKGAAVPWRPTRPGLLRRRLAYGAVYVLVGLLYFVPWTSRKPFLDALFSIRRGMTVAEVERHMAGYKQGTGWVDPTTKQELKINGSMVFRHSDAPQFNSDWGVVTFRDGRVVEVRFDPD